MRIRSAYWPSLLDELISRTSSDRSTPAIRLLVTAPTTPAAANEATPAAVSAAVSCAHDRSWKGRGLFVEGSWKGSSVELGY